VAQDFCGHCAERLDFVKEGEFPYKRRDICSRLCFMELVHCYYY
jgi:hypothetical protein